MRKILSIIFLSILLTSSYCCATSAEKVDATKGVVLSTEKIILPGPIDKESWEYKTKVGVTEAVAKVQLPKIVTSDSGSNNAMDMMSLKFTTDLVEKLSK